MQTGLPSENREHAREGSEPWGDLAEERGEGKAAEALPPRARAPVPLEEGSWPPPLASRAATSPQINWEGALKVGCPRPFFLVLSLFIYSVSCFLLSPLPIIKPRRPPFPPCLSLLFLPLPRSFPLCSLPCPANFVPGPVARNRNPPPPPSSPHSPLPTLPDHVRPHDKLFPVRTPNGLAQLRGGRGWPD